MNSKKQTTLSGILLTPLTVGNCAFIRHNGNTMRTSRVVSISEVNARQIRFETMNTRYVLLAPAMEQSEPVMEYAGAAA